MTKLVRIWRGKTVRAILFAAVASAAMLTLSPQAQAVIVDGGFIETDGINTTVDLFEFNPSQSGAFSPGLAELPVNPPRISHPAIKLYRADGPSAGTLVAAADATTPGQVNLNAMLAAGDYIMAVSEFNLAAGNFGPLNPAAVNKIGYQYEFGISGGQDQYVSSTCDYSGNLNGTFTLKSGLASCSAQPALPTYQPASVPEPDSIVLLVAGLVGLAAAHGRIKAGVPQLKARAVRRS